MEPVQPVLEGRPQVGVVVIQVRGRFKVCAAVRVPGALPFTIKTSHVRILQSIQVGGPFQWGIYAGETMKIRQGVMGGRGGVGKGGIKGGGGGGGS